MKRISEYPTDRRTGVLISL